MKVEFSSSSLSHAFLKADRLCFPFLFSDKLVDFYSEQYILRAFGGMCQEASRISVINAYTGLAECGKQILECQGC